MFPVSRCFQFPVLCFSREVLTMGMGVGGGGGAPTASPPSPVAVGGGRGRAPNPNATRVHVPDERFDWLVARPGPQRAEGGGGGRER